MICFAFSNLTFLIPRTVALVAMAAAAPHASLAKTWGSFKQAKAGRSAATKSYFPDTGRQGAVALSFCPDS